MARLSKAQIIEIVRATHEGEPRSQIAARLQIDTSTVAYHTEKFEQTYGSFAAVYSLIPPPAKACSHPSLKCLLCGTAQDNIRSRDRETIHHLTSALGEANELLVRLGYEPKLPAV